ncbi:hypothetical protein RUM43_008206 [Polyplax serrata]|uniref:Uncharacterized protein n=1 Tax=Polyplax serrata TaxID=468196 RepID=A0AAN8P704_POLSC
MPKGSQLGSPVPVGQVLIDQAVADNPEDEEEGLYLAVILTLTFSNSFFVVVRSFCGGGGLLDRTSTQRKVYCIAHKRATCQSVFLSGTLAYSDEKI